MCIMLIHDENTALLEGAHQVLGEHGWHDTTMERIAQASGISRMTLHRRGVTREAVLCAPGSGADRLARALEAECAVAEVNLALLGALEDRERDVIFHGEDPAGLTSSVFTDPLVRLLTDGAADGSLRDVDDVAEVATVLFNLVGFTYRHLRVGHRWNPERARRGVLEIVLKGLEP